MIGSLYAGWRYHTTGAVWSYSSACGELEAAVNDALSRQKLQNAQMLRVIHTERNANCPLPTQWVESERELLVPSQKTVAAIVSDLKPAAKKLQLNTFNQNIQQQEAVVEIGKSEMVFQRLIFRFKKS